MASSGAGRLFAATLILAGIISASFVTGPATAAEFTSIMSAADKGDPWDGVLGVRYDWLMRQSSISREYICDSTEPGCPAESGVVRRSEVDSLRDTHFMNIDLRIGLYRDFEFFATFPFAVRDRSSLSFSSGVSRANSTVFPSVGPGLFEVPHNAAVRRGFGDMSLGLRVAAMNQFRNRHHPTLVLTATYTAPTGTVRRAGGNGVGEGLHKIRFDIAASRRIAFFDPYFGLFAQYMAPATTRNTLFKDYGKNQDHVGPGPELGLNLGGEFYIWNPPKDEKQPDKFATVDLGFNARYRFQGREYTDLFDAFGTSPCAGDAGCVSPTSSKNLMAYNLTTDGASHAITYMDGITNVSSYGVFSTWVGISVQPVKYVSMGFRFTYAYETGHFLTNASPGDALKSAGGSTPLSNADGTRDFNPVFNSDVDLPGFRFYSEGAHMYGIMLMLTGRY